MPLHNYRVRTVSLDIELPFGKTLAISMTLVVFVLFVFELIVRVPGISGRLLPQSYLLPDTYDLKLALLEHQDSIPNCFVIGSSVANAAFHAEEMKANLHGPDEPLYCFNFSAPGIIPSMQIAIARYLLNEYNPRVLVYGIYFGDVGQRSNDNQRLSLERSSWLSYKAGKFNVHGALIEHSALFRTVLAYRKWANHDYFELTAETRSVIQMTGEDGTLRNTVQLGENGLALDPSTQMALFTFYENLTVSNNELSAIQEIIDLARAHNTRIIIVETPVHPDLLAQIPELETKYQEILTTVSALLAEKGVPFLQVDDFSIFLDQAWVDDNHLNQTGSDIFTDWLEDPLQQVLDTP